MINYWTEHFSLPLSSLSLSSSTKVDGMMACAVKYIYESTIRQSWVSRLASDRLGQSPAADDICSILRDKVQLSFAPGDI
jgi:hypothetical protein